jgi:hypothetical protein
MTNYTRLTAITSSVNVPLPVVAYVKPEIKTLTTCLLPLITIPQLLLINWLLQIKI